MWNKVNTSLVPEFSLPRAPYRGLIGVEPRDLVSNPINGAQKGKYSFRSVA